MDITLQIILCLLVADFLTGFVHWLEDSYCLDTIPLIGKSVCKPNIDHHEFPTLMNVSKSILLHIYQSSLLALFVFFIFYMFNALTWQVVLTGVMASFGNQIHAWNHEAKSSYLVTWLKDSGLIQSQKQHNLHHIPPYNKCYCVLINFNNAWLDRINFWRGLEYVLSLLGLKVKRGMPERRGY